MHIPHRDKTFNDLFPIHDTEIAITVDDQYKLSFKTKKSYNTYKWKRELLFVF